MINISITTTTLGISDLVEIPEIVHELDAKIELSSNCSFISNKENIEKFSKKLYIHNYSPRPNIPFVLNLASKKEKTLKDSMAMIKNNVNLAHKLSTPIYSFHAGYASDIEPQMLGKKITSDIYDSREEIYRKFKSRCRSCSEIAKNLGVRLLVENNVLGKKNFNTGKEKLLFLSHEKEINSFFQDMYEYCGLILDVGHLKVSANNLGFDLDYALHSLAPFTEALHLSDNLGEEDTNDDFDTSFWFLPYFKLFKKVNYIAIETKAVEDNKIKSMFNLVSNSL